MGMREVHKARRSAEELMATMEEKVGCLQGCGPLWVIHVPVADFTNVCIWAAITTINY